jgi:hypothetical protein
MRVEGGNTRKGNVPVPHGPCKHVRSWQLEGHGLVVQQNMNITLKVEYYSTGMHFVRREIRTSQETNYVSTTESSQLMLCKI